MCRRASRARTAARARASRVPIAPSLAMRLKQAAAGRGASEPLLPMKNGERWTCGRHRILFHKAAEAAHLPDGATMYCLEAHRDHASAAGRRSGPAGRGELRHQRCDDRENLLASTSLITVTRRCGGRCSTPMRLRLATSSRWCDKRDRTGGACNAPARSDQPSGVRTWARLRANIPPERPSTIPAGFRSRPRISA